MPARTGSSLTCLLKNTDNIEFIIDGTERPVRRPKNSKKQKERYSGKKKRHTIKNVIVINKNNKQIIGLTSTEGGKHHDKKLIDDAKIKWRKDNIILGDSGFRAYSPNEAIVKLPIRKPCKKEFSPLQKAINKAFSSIRVRVEHAICGIKRCNIVSDVHRSIKLGFDDIVMHIACGLHNFRSFMRQPV